MLFMNKNYLKLEIFRKIVVIESARIHLNIYCKDDNTVNGI